MTCECLHRDHSGHAEQHTSFYRTSAVAKVRISSGIARILWFTKRPTQLYAISVTALWTYDYLLTLGDEVGSANKNDAGRKLTILCRFDTYGKRTTFPVRGPSRFSPGDPNHNISVLSLFIFVSTPSQHHIRPDHRLDQISPGTTPGVGEDQ